jgi:hypothetical protein
LASIAIAAVILVSLLWGVLAQSSGQQAEGFSPLAYGSQIYLPLEFKGFVLTPSPTPYGGALLLPPALRAEQPFQEASVAGRFLAVAVGVILLVGALVTRMRIR